MGTTVTMELPVPKVLKVPKERLEQPDQQGPMERMVVARAGAAQARRRSLHP